MASSWYNELKRPPFTPPNKAFGIVWSILYLLIFISLGIYLFTPAKPNLPLTAGVLIVHALASVSWTPLFFRQHKMLAALFDILLLDVTLVVIITLFLQVSLVAALLLIPYLCWGLFATYLNLAFYRLNR